MKATAYIDYEPFQLTDEIRNVRIPEYYQFMNRRRSMRAFSSEPLPKEWIVELIKTAGTAPSGANKQPWHFCAISNPDIKRQIREAAEKEEYENYHGRMSEEWLQDLEVFETDWQKPFLEIAPWLIVVFKKSYDIDPDGSHHKNYYVNESVGLACGMLLSAIHQAGLVALTHTPSPMNFLTEIMKRPVNERPYLLIPVGKPAIPCQVPDIQRKNVEEILSLHI